MRFLGWVEYSETQPIEGVKFRFVGWVEHRETQHLPTSNPSTQRTKIWISRLG